MGDTFGLKIPAPMASRMKLTMNGARPFPACKRDGTAPPIIITCATPPTITPQTIALNLPIFASASQAPKIGIVYERNVKSKPIAEAN